MYTHVKHIEQRVQHSHSTLVQSKTAEKYLWRCASGSKVRMTTRTTRSESRSRSTGSCSHGHEKGESSDESADQGSVNTSSYSSLRNCYYLDNHKIYDRDIDDQMSQPAASGSNFASSYIENNDNGDGDGDGCTGNNDDSHNPLKREQQKEDNQYPGSVAVSPIDEIEAGRSQRQRMQNNRQYPHPHPYDRSTSFNPQQYAGNYSTTQPLHFQRHFMDILNRATRTRTLHTSVRAVIPTVISTRLRAMSSGPQQFHRRHHGGDNFSDSEDDSKGQSVCYDDETASSVTMDSAVLQHEQELQFMEFMSNNEMHATDEVVDMLSSSYVSKYSESKESYTNSDVVRGARIHPYSSPSDDIDAYNLDASSLPSYYNEGNRLDQQANVLDANNCNSGSNEVNNSHYLPYTVSNIRASINESHTARNNYNVNAMNDSSSTVAVGNMQQANNLHIENIESTSRSSGTEASNLNFAYHASPDSKYETYAIHVDRTQDDRACEIAIFSFDRPHMRGFHLAWLGFFLGFFVWYAITPLLSEVQESLNLSKAEIWTSSICAAIGSTICRVLMGPLTDVYGARICMGVIIILASIPTACIGLVGNLTWLCIVRALISIAGSAFVMCQAWTTIMFTKEVAGTANALAAGWGNLGGGLAQIVMGSILFPMFKSVYLNINPEKSDAEAIDFSWRIASIIPALFAFLYGIYSISNSDDCPKGNYHKLKR